MLHKAPHSFLCVRSAQPKGTIEIQGCGGDNNTAGVWFHRPCTGGIHACSVDCAISDSECCHLVFAPRAERHKETFLTSPGTLITATAAALVIHQNLWYCPREGIACCQNLLESPCTRKWVIEPTAKSRELMMAGRPWKKMDQTWFVGVLYVCQ